MIDKYIQLYIDHKPDKPFRVSEYRGYKLEFYKYEDPEDKSAARIGPFPMYVIWVGNNPMAKYRDCAPFLKGNREFTWIWSEIVYWPNAMEIGWAKSEGLARRAAMKFIRRFLRNLKTDS